MDPISSAISTVLQNLLSSLQDHAGINVSTNQSNSSIQIGTNTAMITFGDVLNNGNQTTRTVKFSNLINDKQPTVAISPSGLQFGQGGATAPSVALTYSGGVPDGISIASPAGQGGKTLRTDIIGAVTASAIQSKSSITLDPGTTLRTDNIQSTTSGSSINIGNVSMSTIKVDIIQPNTLNSVVCNNITVDTIKAVNEATSNSIYLNAGVSVNGSMTCGSIIGTGGVLNLTGSPSSSDPRNTVASNAPLSVDVIKPNSTGFVTVTGTGAS